MLDIFRANAQSIGVKFIFALIILVFVGWGIGSFTDRSAGNVVAMVNGEAITSKEFSSAMQRAESFALRQNPNISREDLAKQGLGRQVLNELVQQKLLQQLANKMHLSATPLEMRQHIENVTAFHNDQGKFDPAVYESVLQRQRINVADYEADLAREIQMSKIVGLAEAAAWYNPISTKWQFDFLRQRRNISYIFLPASNFPPTSPPTEQEINDYYTKHTADFMIPRKISVEYVRIAPLDIADFNKISEEDINKWYEKHQQDFAITEKVKASHILVELAKDASEEEVKKAEEKIASIRAELTVENFASIADQYNSARAAGAGGALGWLERGQTVPPFEEAAFSLEAGKISAPVRSEFGLHLILVEAKQEAGFKALAEVKKEIQERLAQEQGADKINDVLDSLLEASLLGKDLAKTASEYNLKLENTELCTQSELATTLQIENEAAANLINLEANTPLDSPLTSGDSYLICRVKEVAEQKLPGQEEVKDKIISSLQKNYSINAAMTEATSLREKLEADPADKDITEQMESATIQRGSDLTGFASNIALSQDIFKLAEAGKWLDKAIPVRHNEQGEGALLCRLDSIQIADPQEWQTMQGIMEQLSERERAQSVLNIFLQQIMDKADIKVLEREIIDNF